MITLLTSEPDNNFKGNILYGNFIKSKKNTKCESEKYIKISKTKIEYKCNICKKHFANKDSRAL